jgi:hypothetical protein
VSKRPHPVRKQRDPSADRIDPRRTLEHPDVVASSAQRDRRAQPRDAATDHDHAHHDE